MRSRIVLAAIVLMVSCLLCPLASADSFNVTITTTPIQGQNGYALFDFLQGDAGQNNTVTISNFMTDAMLGSGIATGAVSGTLVPGPLTLSDSQFFNEWAQAMVYGGTISFTLNLSTNTSLGAVPDEFSFFLTDSSGVPFQTSDPTGADSLFTIDITGSPLSPEVFTSDFASVTLSPINEVPEPPSAMLIMSLLGICSGMLGFAKLKRASMVR
jgi:hypothetical protein